MAFSKTIQLYIFDGNPNGRIMCELSNWNGRVYKIARNEIAAFSRRADSDHTGVYFLLGKNEENRDTVYIGEAEKVATRLQHIPRSPTSISKRPGAPMQRVCLCLTASQCCRVPPSHPPPWPACRTACKSYGIPCLKEGSSGRTSS